jgi:hypothetical protein
LQKTTTSQLPRPGAVSTSAIGGGGPGLSERLGKRFSNTATS